MNCMQFSETDQQVKLEFKDVSYFSSVDGDKISAAIAEHNSATDAHSDIRLLVQGLEDELDGKQPVGSYITKEQDPTVPEWAKQPQKPAYTAQEVGALPDTTHIPSTADDVNAEPYGAVAQHNVYDAAHSDIRLLISGLSERLSAVADSDDTTLDQLSEIVAYIKSNKSLIDAVTTSKVNVADIVDNLTTNVVNKPLSAAQGVALKALIDAITVPTTLSELSEDTTHRVVTDAEKEKWNAKSNFSGSYNDLTDKPTIPHAYTLPVASSTALGGVQPVDKTDAMTQAVGVDANGALWTELGSGGGSGGEHLVLLNSITMAEDGTFSITQDFDGNPISEKHIIVAAKIPAYSAKKDANLKILGSDGTYAFISWGFNVFTTVAFHFHEIVVVGGELLDRFVSFSAAPSGSANGGYNSRYIDFPGDICGVAHFYNFVPAGTEVYVYAVR